jgi:multiple sugar transport system ATP-binding protein
LRETPETVPGRIYTIEPTGDLTYAHVMLGTSTIVASIPPDRRLQPDQPVWVAFDPQKLHLFDAKTGQALPTA